jgi:hypothetical protein
VISTKSDLVVLHAMKRWIELVALGDSIIERPERQRHGFGEFDGEDEQLNRLIGLRVYPFRNDVSELLPWTAVVAETNRCGYVRRNGERWTAFIAEKIIRRVVPFLGNRPGELLSLSESERAELNDTVREYRERFFADHPEEKLAQPVTRRAVPDGPPPVLRWDGRLKISFPASGR